MEDGPARLRELGGEGQATQHRFQVLTKRPERLAQLAPSLAPPSNVWLGVSVENQDYVERARILRRVKASVRFLSVEPLLGSELFVA